MDVFTSMYISSSALTAQRTRLNVISSNLANAGTTRTPEGGPYRKQEVVFRTSNQPFAEQLDQAGQQAQAVRGVEVAEVRASSKPFRTVHDPGHPDADANGMLTLPNVDIMEEMVDMMTASRSYEANVTAVKSAQRMALKALEIGK